MLTQLFSLAFSGLLRRRRTSLMTLAALMISFAAGVVSLSLLGSISRTNAEYRYNTYGEWAGAVCGGDRQDLEWLSGREWVDSVGDVEIYGSLTIRYESSEYAIGYADEAYRQMGRLTLDDGRWPEAEDEVAVEARMLNSLGYEPVCGQDITLNGVHFKLCGIIHSYSALWEIFSPQGEKIPLVGAVTSRTGGDYITDRPGKKSVDSGWEHQYFFTVKGNRMDENWRAEVREYLSTRSGVAVPYNYMAYPEDQSDGITVEDTFYYIILAVTFFSVLCIYILQFPREAHTYATFRAIGASRGKLAGLILYELLILLIPAAILGAAGGALITWAALRFIVFGGSLVDPKVVIPWGGLAVFALLWAGAALISRLAVFAAAVRMPLTGRFQMGGRKSLGVKRFRGVSLVALGGLTVATVLIVVRLFPGPDSRMNTYLKYSDYWVKCTSSAAISPDDLELLRSVPGVASADGFNDLPANVSFLGAEETAVTLYAIDEAAWPELFSFRDDAERDAFRRGELVILLVPEDAETVPQECTVIARKGADGEFSAEYPVKTAFVTVKDHGGRMGTVCYVVGAPFWADRTMRLHPYDIFCSHALLENMLASMEANKTWGDLVTGEEYSYGNVFLKANSQAKDLSTDSSLEKICVSNKWFFNNYRERYQAIVQRDQQMYVLIFSVGISVVLVAVMILWSVLALEAEQERRRFGLLRALGMSKRQVRRGLVKTAAARSLISVAAGWCINVVYLILKSDLSGIFRRISNVFSAVIPANAPAFALALISSAIFLFTLAIVSKRKIMKGGAGDVCDIISAGAV